MEIKRNEAITAAGLRVSMPMPGVVRVTDGCHKGSYMVSAVLRKSAPKVDGDRLTWGKITVEPENGMALYFEGKLLCRDYAEKRRPRTSLSLEEVNQLLSEGHIPDEFMPNSDKWKVEVVKELLGSLL